MVIKMTYEACIQLQGGYKKCDETTFFLTLRVNNAIKILKNSLCLDAPFYNLQKRKRGTSNNHPVNSSRDLQKIKYNKK